MFFRLFGGGDGDGDVDADDEASFLGSFGLVAGDPAFLWYFDYDGDDDVDEQYRDEFHLRFGTSLAIP